MGHARTVRATEGQHGDVVGLGLFSPEADKLREDERQQCPGRGSAMGGQEILQPGLTVQFLVAVHGFGHPVGKEQAGLLFLEGFREQRVFHVRDDAHQRAAQLVQHAGPHR